MWATKTQRGSGCLLYSLSRCEVVRRASERAIEFEVNGEFPVIVCSILRIYALVLIFYV